MPAVPWKFGQRKQAMQSRCASAAYLVPVGSSLRNHNNMWPSTPLVQPQHLGHLGQQQLSGLLSFAESFDSGSFFRRFSWLLS